VLHLDWETFSDRDIKAVGHYNYVESPMLEILMGGYRFGRSETLLWVPAEGEDMPDDLESAILDPYYPISAWNAAFERQVIRRVWGQKYARPERFHCVMAHAMYGGMPGDLDQAGTAMGLPQDKQKLSDGKKLIQRFCKPAPSNHKAFRYNHETHPAEWLRFKEYCIRDVDSEASIDAKLQRHIPFPDRERLIYLEDQRINDRGLRIHLPSANAALRTYEKHKKTLTRRAIAISGLQNPGSTAQARQWCLDNGCPPDLLPNMQKETLEEVTNRPDVVPSLVLKFLELRSQISLSSISKYEKMVLCHVAGYLHGCLQYYGANRTGRWAGRLIQPQNLPRGIFEKYQEYLAALGLLELDDPELIEWIYDDCAAVISSLIRPMIRPSEGCRLIVSDLSAIEARVLAWLANVEWRLEVFRTHGKIYEASAAQTFKVPLADILQYKKDHGSHHPLRKKGKVTELAMGYQGWVGALIRMGALKEGLQFEELEGMAAAWREANPEVPKLWYDCEEAAKTAIRRRTTVTLGMIGVKRKRGDRPCDVIEFSCDGSFLTIKLPSGRKLFYRKPRVNSEDSITYMGVDQQTKRWTVQETYGGKLVENIVQAISRDIICDQMLELAGLGYRINLLVHDEIVADQPLGTGSLEEMIEVMSRPIEWAPGLPLGAAGFESDFYYKD